MTVGINVKNLRKSRGYTQMDLAVKSDLLQTTISAVERGADPTSTTLMKLANGLGVPPSDLLTEKEVTK